MGIKNKLEGWIGKVAMSSMKHYVPPEGWDSVHNQIFKISHEVEVLAGQINDINKAVYALFEYLNLELSDKDIPDFSYPPPTQRMKKIWIAVKKKGVK